MKFAPSLFLASFLFAPSLAMLRGSQDHRHLSITNPQEACADEAYQALRSKIMSFHGTFQTDTEEWNEFVSIATTATTFQEYQTQVVTSIWTDGLDQGSWGWVWWTAHNSVAFNNAPMHAVNEILYAFERITDPSHNDDYWASLADMSAIYRDGTSGLHCTKVTGSWTAYTQILSDDATINMATGFRSGGSTTVTSTVSDSPNFKPALLMQARS